MEIRGKRDSHQHEPHDGVVMWRLLTGRGSGAERIGCELTEFQPGSAHPLHRHPHAEQIHFIVRGSGLRLLRDGDRIPQTEGEVALIPRGEWHGFENNTEERTVVFSAFGGAADLDGAGYEELSE